MRGKLTVKVVSDSSVARTAGVGERNYTTALAASDAGSVIGVNNSVGKQRLHPSLPSFSTLTAVPASPKGEVVDVC